MRALVAFIESRNGFSQFLKYAIAGAASTCVQLAVFYLIATLVLPCLGANDIAVRLANLPAVDISDGVRASRAAVAQGVGFIVANMFCWAVNRRFVFKPGRHFWFIELALFFALSLVAFTVGIALQSLAIDRLGWQTSLAVALQVVTSLCINFIVRKFFIFKG